MQKNNFLLILSLLCFLGILPRAYAQSEQKIIVSVMPDHADWQYKTKETVTFKVEVLQDDDLLENVTLDYELGPEYFPEVTKQDVVLKKGKTTLKGKMTVPGFYRCKVTAKVNGKKYTGMATAGYDVDKILPTTSEPEDFDVFWSKAISSTQKNPLKAIMQLLPDRCTPTKKVYEVSFQNEYTDSRIYGILMIPAAEGKYPAVLSVPGAGVRSYNGYNLGDDVITLQIGIHGVPVTYPDDFYRDLKGGALRNYQFFNKNNRNEYYYKRVYTGCIRAIDFIYSLPEFDGKTVGVTGGSQGGALAIVTAALDSRVKFLLSYYPALCDYAGYLNGRAGGWPHYFRRSTPKPNEIETLAYFDIVNFARRIKVPGWYSWGFNDTTCPPTSMHAAYNVISADKKMDLYPITGHRTCPEQKQTGDNWLKEQCKK